MKRIIMLSLLFLISCGEDEFDLSGEWDIYYLSIVNCANVNDNIFIDRVEDDCTRIAGKDVCFNTLLTFSESNATLTVTTTQGSASSIDVSSFTYEVDGNQMTFCETTNDCWVGSLKLTETRFEFAAAGQQDGCSVIIRGDRI